MYLESKVKLHENSALALALALVTHDTSRKHMLLRTEDWRRNWAQCMLDRQKRPRLFVCGLSAGHLTSIFGAVAG